MEERRKRGLGVSHHVRAGDCEIISDALRAMAGDGSDKAVRAHLSKLFDQAISQELRRLMLLYSQSPEGRRILSEIGSEAT